MEIDQKITQKQSRMQRSLLDFLVKITTQMQALLEHLIKAERHPEHIQVCEPFLKGLPTVPLALLFTTGPKTSHKARCAEKHAYEKYLG